MEDRLRRLWDFNDLDSTEERFRSELTQETSEDGRAEVLTQLARIEGLRGKFDEGERLIEQADARAGSNGVARARIELERGRLRRSSGRVETSFPLFESAFAIALDAHEYFIAADAAHMAALAAPSRDDFVAWTKHGIELAEAQETASYWLGPLLNNLGWEYFEAGELDSALDAFERGIRAREGDPENAEAIALAQYAVGKTLRSLGRPEEAVPLLEQAVAWTESVSAPDGWLHEELAEEYAALGRSAEARTHAQVALDLLPSADPTFESETGRAERLRRLAGKSLRG
jgi:tetratricopeptide (TPR) repeat protein